MKMCKMKKTQEEITAFKKAQEIWKEQERKRLEEENVRLQIYIREKLDEEDARYYNIKIFIITLNYMTEKNDKIHTHVDDTNVKFYDLKS